MENLKFILVSWLQAAIVYAVAMVVGITLAHSAECLTEKEINKYKSDNSGEKMAERVEGQWEGYVEGGAYIRTASCQGSGTKYSCVVDVFPWHIHVDKSLTKKWTFSERMEVSSFRLHDGQTCHYSIGWKTASMGWQ